MDVVKYLEKKSENNPKDIAKEKKDERRQQRALKAKEKKKKKKGNRRFHFQNIVIFKSFSKILICSVNTLFRQVPILAYRASFSRMRFWVTLSWYR